MMTTKIVMLLCVLAVMAYITQATDTEQQQTDDTQPAHIDEAARDAQETPDSGAHKTQTGRKGGPGARKHKDVQHNQAATHQKQANNHENHVNKVRANGRLSGMRVLANNAEDLEQWKRLMASQNFMFPQAMPLKK